MGMRRKTLIGGAVALGTGIGVYELTKPRHSKKSDSGTGTGGDGESEDIGEEGIDDGTGGDGSSSGDGSGKTKTKTKVVEIPIDNYEEAMDFARREWNKIKRNNGRTLECQVLGSPNWQVGEWCRVYLPSFDIDGYMYIIRTSQSSDGGDWTTNLSLVDYPPGWGKEELKSDDDEEDDEDENSEDNENSEDSEDSEDTDSDEDTGEDEGE